MRFFDIFRKKTGNMENVINKNIKFINDIL